MIYELETNDFVDLGEIASISRIYKHKNDKQKFYGFEVVLKSGHEISVNTGWFSRDDPTIDIERIRDKIIKAWKDHKKENKK